MYNHRTEPRKKLMAFTPVYELRLKNLLGYVEDLTLKGVMVVGQKSIDVDKHFTLGIEFPEGGAASAVVRIALPARAAWCRQDESPQYFNIGFEFSEVSPENAKVIESVLERYQFRPALGSDFKF